MNKQDVIDAINNVIVTNDQKGITAESLARVLLDMLEVTPESSGGSGMAFVKVGVAGDGSDLTEEDKAHNAIIYEQAQSGNLPGPIVMWSEGIYLISPFMMVSEDRIEVLFGMPDFMVGATTGCFQMPFQVEIYADGSIKFNSGLGA